MDVLNYIPFDKFSNTYPVNNHSSRIYLPIVKTDPTPSDRQDYVDQTYFAEDYLA